MRSSAVLTIDWLLARCVEDGGCLIWQGYACNDGRDPRAKIDGKVQYVRRAVWALLKGRKPPTSHLVGASCGVVCCMEPAHLICRSRSEAFTGVPKSLLMRARLAKTKRVGSKISDECAAEIRVSQLSASKEAAKRGISKDMVNKIRSGALRRDYSSPFAGLGAQR